MKTALRILVTGGAGMIGSNLVKRLVGRGYDVSVIDNLWRGKLEYLTNDGKPIIDLERHFHEVDLAIPHSADHLFQGIDFVFHLADIVAGIGYVFSNQGDIFRQNVLINSNVIRADRRHLPK